MPQGEKTKSASSVPFVVVVDASAIIDLYLGNAAGVRVASEMDGRAVLAPAHMDAEVLSALGRLVRGGVVSDGTVRQVLNHLAQARITRVPLVTLLEDAWDLRSNVSIPDAPYIALARRIGATLLTCDMRLARTPGIGVHVLVASA